MSDQDAEEVVQLYPPWRHAIQRLLDGEHGPQTVVTFEQLYDWFGVAMPKPETPLQQAEKAELAYLSQFKKFEEHLLTESQLALQNVVGIGYRIVDPKEQSQWGYEYFHREFRKGFIKGLRRIRYTNLSALSLSERQEHADILAKMSAIRQMLTRRGIQSALSRTQIAGDAG